VNERPVLVVKNPDIPQCSPVRREERTGKITTLLATERVLNFALFSVWQCTRW